MPTEDPVESLLDRWDSAYSADPRASVDAFLLAEGSQLDEAEQARFRMRAEALALVNRGLGQVIAVSSGPVSGGISSKPTGLPHSEFTAGMEPVSGYILESRIGKGGFGEVWRATGPGGMPVALKILSCRAETLRTELESLENIKGVRHPHLLAVAAYWQQADRLFIASELADGTLFDRLQQVHNGGGTGIPVDELVQYMTEAAEAIDFLNLPQSDRHPMQHGDIKPQNLLLMSGSVKVGDFGLIRPLYGAEADHHGTMTIQYAAPEFLAGKLSAASDQFSLAVTYCCLRTGRLPFAGSLPEYRESIRNGRADLRGLTLAERAVIRRALAVAPKNRFPSCREFANELETAVRQSSAALRFRAFFATVALAALSVAISWGVVAWFRTRYSPPPVIAPFNATIARKHQEDWAEHLGIGVETTNSIGQTLIVIPSGRFMMGEGDDTIEVSLRQPFLLGQTEVTQGQWKEVMGTEPWKGQAHTIEDSGAAATFVSWHDAHAFCVKLTIRERGSGRLGDEQAYRLPTEAEWEFACRAGTVTMFSCGDAESLVGDYAWFGGGYDQEKNALRPGGNTAMEMYAHAVGLKQPNPFGLYDMHGNVWEWCQAEFTGSQTSRDTATHESGKSRFSERFSDLKNAALVFAKGAVHKVRSLVGGTLPSSEVAGRGGSWSNQSGGTRSAITHKFDPLYRFDNIGFRVALSLSEAEPPAAPTK